MKRILAVIFIAVFVAALATSCSSYNSLTHKECIGQKPNNHKTGRQR
ncbi:MAG: hypothetical protein ACOCZ8_02210 [Bacteroidota bacterium]